MKSHSAQPPIVFLSEEAVLEIHTREIARRGGRQGVRDRRLLLSALAQPMMQFGGKFLHQDLSEMAAAYVYHLGRNHPFVDGNKRVAAASAAVLLGLNGYRITEKGTRLADMVNDAIENHRSKLWIAKKLRAIFKVQ